MRSSGTAKLFMFVCDGPPNHDAVESNGTFVHELDALHRKVTELSNPVALKVTSKVPLSSRKAANERANGLVSPDRCLRSAFLKVGVQPAMSPLLEFAKCCPCEC